MRRTLAILVLAASLACLAACQAGPTSADSEALPARRVAPEQVVPPPGLPASQVVPRQGPALDRARLPLNRILADLPSPAHLTRAQGQPPPLTRPSGQEPSLPAQRAYIAGRQAWLERNAFESIRQLQTALALAPDDPDILALLGRVYTEAGNRVRGAEYLTRAVAIHPDDTMSLFLLARHEFDQEHWPAAIVGFAVLLQRGPDLEDDPSLRPVVSYYLGSALEREGHDAAAIEQYRGLLERPVRFGRTTRFIRELAFLSRNQPTVWTWVGDAWHRLGEPARALHAYRSAAAMGLEEQNTLLLRLMYTHLRLGRTEEATGPALAMLRRGGGDEQSAAVIGYLVDQGVPPHVLLPPLRQVYKDAGRPAHLAVTIARLLKPAPARAFLVEHLAGQPADRAVFEQLVQGQLRTGTRASASEAIRTAAATIEALPAAAPRYAGIMLDAAADHNQLLVVMDALPRDERERSALRYLRGLILIRLDRPEQAIPELEQALAAPQPIEAARTELVGLLLKVGRIEDADRVLAAAPDPEEPAVLVLRARVLAERGEPLQAIELLNEALAQPSPEADLFLHKARLHAHVNDPRTAERTLLDGINAHPRAEPLYAELFRLYLAAFSGPEEQERTQRLLQQAASAIPEARITRFQTAVFYARRGLIEQSGQLLRALVDQNPRDLEALEVLLIVLNRGGQKDEAMRLLHERLEQSPRDRELLGVAQRIYALLEERGRFLHVTEQLLLLQPASFDRSRQLAAVYLQSDRPEKALAVLDEMTRGPIEDPSGLISLMSRALRRLDRAAEVDARAAALIARFPDKDADLIFEWATSLFYRRQFERAEAKLVELLRRHPKHAAANNTLGYTWADEGRNLAEAERMIRIAIEAEPDNAAYLDSLGWVFYKRGRFEEALAELEKARRQRGGDDPVILDHLGDVLYRLGRHEEAVATWRLAQERIDPDEADDHPETAEVPERLRRKLEAVRAGQPVPVAEVPQGGE